MATPQITWTNIIITVGAFATLLSFGASVVQYQLAGLDTKITRTDRDALDRDAAAKHDDEIRDRRIISRFEGVDQELLRRAELFLSTKEFKEFKDHIYSDNVTLNKRLDSLEQTRPTAGELKAVADGMRDTLSRLEERIRSLENAPRSPKPP
jgi:hypothetical protein